MKRTDILLVLQMNLHSTLLKTPSNSRHPQILELLGHSKLTSLFKPISPDHPLLPTRQVQYLNGCARRRIRQRPSNSRAVNWTWTTPRIRHAHARPCYLLTSSHLPVVVLSMRRLLGMLMLLSKGTRNLMYLPSLLEGVLACLVVTQNSLIKPQR